MRFVLGGFRRELDGAKTNHRPIARPVNRRIIHDVALICDLYVGRRYCDAVR
jgi:hypothetical protein